MNITLPGFYLTRGGTTARIVHIEPEFAIGYVQHDGDPMSLWWTHEGRFNPEKETCLDILDVSTYAAWQKQRGKEL